ncbi:MAG: M56 family metallopeptidase [Prolixibacteraceae bacterium]|nr:M56 family metallopeptidase [Prolixibacteraceae bacterium]
MNGVINFLFESGISLTIFSIIYVLFLRKETFFRINRLFLLGAVLFSVILPLLKFNVFELQPVLLPEITVTPYRNLIESVTIYGQDLSVSVENAVLSAKMLIWIYMAGVSVLLINYMIRIIRIAILIQKNQVINTGRINLVMLENECSPFSFFNYIFVSRQLQNVEGYDHMIRHEEEHIRQRHSFDILIIELLKVFQWFNPFIWMLGHAIKENHEYLADRAVLETGTDRGYYKKLLLSQITGEQLLLTNNFNYSLVKNRFKMMSKIKSSKIANIKVTLGVLAATAMIIVFACEHKEGSQTFDTTKNATVQENKSDISKDAIVQENKIPEGEDVFFVVEKMPEFPGGDEALRQFITNNISYPELAKDSDIQGKVYVTFVVSKDGSVANAKIARGVDPLLDREALRVVNSLPSWTPGYQNEKPVNVSYTVPINFVLDGDDKENKTNTSLMPDQENIIHTTVFSKNYL